MNGAFQKYGPPAAVIAIAVYLGWPPEAPMDLGEDIVRAKSVRWKPKELDAPPLPTLGDHDPFAKVLVEAPKAMVIATGDPEIIEPEESVGPSEGQIRLGVKLAGIAQTDSHRWAIVNSRVCRCGDVVPVVGLTDVDAKIVAIESDHIQIQACDFDLCIKQPPHQRRRASANVSESPEAATPSAPSATDDGREDDLEDDDEEVDEEDRVRSRENTDPREQFFQQASG